MGGRCGAPGCGRFVRAADGYCGRHAALGGLEELVVAAPEFGADGGETAEAARARRAAVAAFRERLASGDYRALYEQRLGEVIAQAAALGGLADEIGALRFVLARLLAEEEDVSKLAVGVARVTAVAVNAARTQRAISGDAAEGLTAALTQILAELDGES